MIWIILIAILAIILLFWPKIKGMFGGSNTQPAATTTSAPAQSAPALTTSTNQQVISKPATMGPLANLLGSGVGSIANTAVGTVVSVPRALFSGIFRR